MELFVIKLILSLVRAFQMQHATKQNQPPFLLAKIGKKLCQNISGLKALEVIPLGEKRTISPS